MVGDQVVGRQMVWLSLINDFSARKWATLRHLNLAAIHSAPPAATKPLSTKGVFNAKAQRRKEIKKFCSGRAHLSLSILVGNQNECIRSQNRKLSLRAFFAKQSPYRNEEIASSQRTLLAMTQCTEFIWVQILLVTRTNVLWEKLSSSVAYPDYLRKFPPNSGKLCGLPRHWQKFAREIDITDVNFSLVTRSICAQFISAQYTNLPIYQSTNLPIYQSTNLPIYQSTNLPIYQSTTHGSLIFPLLFKI